MQKVTGLSEKRIRGMLRDLIDRKRVECVPVNINAINGASMRSYGYRVLNVASDNQ